MTFDSALRRPDALPDRALVFSRVAALATVLLLSSRPYIGQGVSVGDLAALAFAPLWLPVLKRYPGGRWLFGAGLLATVASVVLTLAAAGDHVVTQNNLVSNTVLITGSVVGVAVLLWAREVLPVWFLGAAWGIGMLVAVVTHQEVLGYNRASGGEINPWKFALAVPVAILLLSLADRTRRRWVEILVLVLLALASARFDSRSYFGEFAIAALLVLWQLLPAPRKRVSPVRIVLVAGILTAAIYNVGTSLVLGGALGAETQARSLEQVQRAGSILVGGRPEMAATAALFLARPLGFGGGTIATFSDVDIAKAGMERINYDPDNGYVENFLFGEKFELHSMAGDLWAYAGLAGVLLVVVAVVLLLVVLARGMAARAASGLVLFLIVQSLWSLFFNPLYASAPVLVAALGLGLLRRAEPVPPSGPPVPAARPDARRGIRIPPAPRIGTGEAARSS